MANFKRQRVGSKKEGRREDNKRLRAAERQELEGGNSRLIRPGKWNQRPQQPLALQERPTQKKGKGHAKKSKQREGCPARAEGKRHHYMHSKRVVPGWKFDRDHWNETGEWKQRRINTVKRYKLCAYCSKEQSLGYEDYDPNNLEGLDNPHADYTNSRSSDWLLFWGLDEW